MPTQITVALITTIITGLFGSVITPVMTKVLTPASKEVNKPGSGGTISTSKSGLGGITSPGRRKNSLPTR